MNETYPSAHTPLYDDSHLLSASAVSLVIDASVFMAHYHGDLPSHLSRDRALGINGTDHH